MHVDWPDMTLHSAVCFHIAVLAHSSQLTAHSSCTLQPQAVTPRQAPHQASVTHEPACS